MSTATLYNEKKKVLIPQLRFQEFDGEWKNKKFGALNEVIDSLHQTPKEYIEEGFAMIRVTDVNDSDLNIEKCLKVSQEAFLEFTKRYNPKKDDIIMSRVGTCGASIKLSSDEPVCLGQNTVLLIPKIEKGFVFTFMKSSFFQNQVEKMTVGSTQKTLSLKDLKNFNFNIPSLPEQQKIASFLSAVDEKIQQLSRKKELLEQYKKGVMQQLFSGKLRFKDENGNDYADWEEKKLGDLVKIKSGNSPSDYQLVNEGVNPFIKVEELNNCSKYQNKSRFYSNDNKNLIETKSVIFPKRGAAILNNKVRINDCPILMDSNMMALIPLRKELDVEFLYSKIVMAELYKIADTSSIPQINNKHIEPYVISTPCLEEQQKIANFLSNIDTKIEATNQQINQTQSFKRSLLQQMFV